MSTVVITGRDLSLEIDSDTYDAQASTVTLTQELERETFEVLSGKVKRVLDEDGALTVEMLADWGTTGSLCAALWEAADTAPDTSLAFTFKANDDEFVGDVFPVKPEVGGTGADATTVTVELPLDGAVTRTPANSNGGNGNGNGD